MLREAVALALALTAAPLAARAADQPLYVDLVVNEVPVESTMAHLRDGDVLVEAAELRKGGLTGFAGAREEIDGKEYVSLRSLAGQLSFKFDEQSLEVRVTAVPALLPRTQLDLTPTPRPKDLVLRRDTSAFLNYAVQGSSPGAMSGFEELGVSVRGNLLYTGLSQTDTGGLARGLSNFTMDEPSAMRRWVAGDAFASTGPLGGNVLLAGLSVSRNFQLDPYFVHAPLPKVQGAALTPSTLDVYVNGVLVRREAIPPGPFEVQNLPVTTGISGVSYVVRDAFGRTEEYSSRGYVTPSLLAEGISDYAYSIGFRRNDFGTASFSYGEPVLLCQHRLGLTDRVTAGYRLEADRNLVNVGPSVGIALPLGQIDASISGSVSGSYTGAAGTFAYTLVARPWTAGASVRAFSRHYANASLAPLDDRSVLDADVFASAMATKRLTLTLDYGVARGRDSGVQDIVQLKADYRLSPKASLTFGVSRQRLLDQVAFWGVTAGFLYTFDASTVGETAVQRQNDQSSGMFALQRALPIGNGVGYQIQANSTQGQTDQLLTSAQANVPYAHFEAAYQRIGDVNGASATVAGSAVLMGDRVLLARPVGEGFALVRVPGVEGVRGYLNNLDVGETDSRGDLFVPNLVPYYGNRLRIRDADVPIDYELGKVEQTVAGPYRGGAVVSFDVRKIQSVTGLIQVEGKGAPAYGQVELRTPGKDLQSPVAADGRFWLDGVPAGRHSASVEWRGGVCRFQLDVPKDGNGPLDVGTLQCEPDRVVSARSQ